MKQGIAQIRKTPTTYEVVREEDSDFQNIDWIPRLAYYPISEDDGSCFMYDFIKYDEKMALFKERGVGRFDLVNDKYEFIREIPISIESTFSLGPVRYWVGQAPTNFTVDKSSQYLVLNISKSIRSLDEFLYFPNSILINIDGDVIPVPFNKLKEILNENT